MPRRHDAALLFKIPATMMRRAADDDVYIYATLMRAMTIYIRALMRRYAACARQAVRRAREHTVRCGKYRRKSGAYSRCGARGYVCIIARCYAIADVSYADELLLSIFYAIVYDDTDYFIICCLLDAAPFSPLFFRCLLRH